VEGHPARFLLDGKRRTQDWLSLPLGEGETGVTRLALCDNLIQSSLSQSAWSFRVKRQKGFPMKPAFTLSLLLCWALALTSLQAQKSEPLAPQGVRLPGGTPADLIGEWSKSNVSTIDFVNPNTGAHGDPSGERFNVRFFSDGHYKLGWLLQSSLYSCTSTVFGLKNGRYTAEGNTLRMNDIDSVLTSKDTCHREWNYEKHPPLRHSTYQ